MEYQTFRILIQTKNMAIKELVNLALSNLLMCRFAHRFYHHKEMQNNLIAHD